MVLLSNIKSRIQDEAKHVRDYGMAAAEDEAIFNLATSEQRVIVSADTDYGTLLSLGGEAKPSMLLN